MRRISIALVAVAACGGATAKPEPATRSEAALAIPTARGKGKVETRRFHSDALGVDKDYVVYLPGGYGDDPRARWPVLYYLNGLTGDETNWTKLGDLGGAADAIELPAIVIMPDGDDGFYANSVTPRDYDACMATGAGLFDPDEDRAKTCVRTARYEDYIVHDLIAHVDATYATIADRRARGIAGDSMGGLGALSLAMRHPDLFSAAASHSGVDALFYTGPHPYEAGKVELVQDVTTWGGPRLPQIGRWVRSIYGADRANWEAHDPASLARTLAPGTLALYLDCGSEDFFGLDAQAAYLHDVLAARAIDHRYYLGPGRHDFDFWRERVKHSLAFFRAHFLGQEPPAEQAAPPAPPPPAITLAATLSSEGTPGDVAQRLVADVVDVAKGCSAESRPADGVRELAFGVTDKGHVADVVWLGDAPHDAFASCLTRPRPASDDKLAYVYVALRIGDTVAAPPPPDRAADLAALCASEPAQIRHPDVLALAHAMATADAEQKRALLSAAVKAAKLARCPLATAR